MNWIAFIFILMLIVTIVLIYCKFKISSLNLDVLKFMHEDTEDFSICNLTCFRRTEIFQQGRKNRNVGFYLLKDANIVEKYESSTSKLCLDYVKDHTYDGATTHLGIISLDRFNCGFCFGRRNVDNTYSVIWFETGLKYNLLNLIDKLY